MTCADNSQPQDKTPSSSNGEGSSGEVFPPNDSQNVASELAQAFTDIARGEQTATMLEANLSSLEAKLDAILSSLEAARGEATQQDDAREKQEPGN